MSARPSAQRQHPRAATGPIQGRVQVRLPDGSRSVQSPWVWRGFLFMSFIALGLCLTLALEGRSLYAAAWAFVTAGWLGIAVWLWRKHLADDSMRRATPPNRGGLRR